MINNHKKIWKCFYTEIETPTLHEIFFGSYGVGRNLCIKYNLQVPVSMHVHDEIHFRPKNERNDKKHKTIWQERCCEWLGIDYEKTLQAVNTKNHDYLESISDICMEKIKNAEA